VAEQETGHDGDRHQQDAENQDRCDRQIDPERQLPGHCNAHRRDTGHIGDAQEPPQLEPGGPAAKAEDDGDPDDAEPQIQRDQPEDRTHAHRRRPIEIPFLSRQRT
jgi:hypothetical protein